jgi:hypothetical protein
MSIKTPYGRACVNGDGYPTISSVKEGNRGKKVHTCSLEEKLGRKLKPGYECHHLDNDKLNWDPENLIEISKADHLSLHHKDKEVSKETRKKLSELNTGKVLTQEHKDNISDGLKDHEVSIETRERLSKLNKGKKHTKMAGENHPNTDLTNQKVRMIKVMLRSDIKTRKQIAKLFNVSIDVIRRIHNNQTWKDV